MSAIRRLYPEPTYYPATWDKRVVPITTVILDRDGVINENRPDHVKNWDEFRFLPGSIQAVSRLADAGVATFIVTNQAIVNRGLVPIETVDAINQKMIREFERWGGKVADVVYCPHRPDEECGCRKPRPGLLLELAERHRFDLRSAVMIGDALTDMEAGARAGCETMMVLTGRGREQLSLARQTGQVDFPVARDLGAAVDALLTRVSRIPLAR